jgi:hypothetical protein
MRINGTRSWISPLNLAARAIDRCPLQSITLSSLFED